VYVNTGYALCIDKNNNKTYTNKAIVNSMIWRDNMTSIGRKLGVNIFTLMQKADISRENIANQLGYSYRDVCRLIEGRLLLPPIELSRVAETLSTTKDNLVNYKSDNSIPELQYMKEFNNPEYLDRILDLLDEYVELKESL